MNQGQFGQPSLVILLSFTQISSDNTWSPCRAQHPPTSDCIRHAACKRVTPAEADPLLRRQPSRCLSRCSWPCVLRSVSDSYTVCKFILFMTENDRCTVERFFEDAPPPTTSIDFSVQAFIRKHTPVDGLQGRPIVCVTSGGTTVPLERRCIRFIDNFSGGTRGALSVEQFLQVQWPYMCHGPFHDLIQQAHLPCRQDMQSSLCTEKGQFSPSPKGFLVRSSWIF